MTLATVALIGLVSASYASYCGILIWSGNFHAVEEGQIYRSSQLTKTQFAHEIGTHHIRSILNLRGSNPNDSWYQDEIAVSQEHGVSHYDVGISARQSVSPEKIAEILAVLRDAPKPILVHCMSGSDRSGFVSALYRYAIQGQSAEVAERELSLQYGHFPYLTSKTGAMDKSFETWALFHKS